MGGLGLHILCLLLILAPGAPVLFLEIDGAPVRASSVNSQLFGLRRSSNCSLLISLTLDVGSPEADLVVCRLSGESCVGQLVLIGLVGSDTYTLSPSSALWQAYPADYAARVQVPPGPTPALYTLSARSLAPCNGSVAQTPSASPRAEPPYQPEDEKRLKSGGKNPVDLETALTAGAVIFVFTALVTLLCYSFLGRKRTLAGAVAHKREASMRFARRWLARAGLARPEGEAGGGHAASARGGGPLSTAQAAAAREAGRARVAHTLGGGAGAGGGGGLQRLPTLRAGAGAGGAAGGAARPAAAPAAPLSGRPPPPGALASLVASMGGRPGRSPPPGALASLVASMGGRPGSGGLRAGSRHSFPPAPPRGRQAEGPSEEMEEGATTDGLRFTNADRLSMRIETLLAAREAVAAGSGVPLGGGSAEEEAGGWVAEEEER